MFASKAQKPMSATLRVLAALLSYPDAQMRGYLPEMRELLHAEGVLSQARIAALEALMRSVESAEPLEAEAHYVELFDRGRGTSLHLFEHVHGDSRERGPALIDLGRTYAQAGLILAEGELPDYLPAVLEFVSTQPPREARDFLAEMTHLYNAIYGALRKRGSGYASVLGALVELAGKEPQAADPPAEEPIDDAWTEPAAFDGCSTKGQAAPGEPQAVRIVRKPTPAQGVHP